MEGPVTVAISDGKRNKVVHINRLQHRVQPMESDEHAAESSPMEQWRPPEIEHFIDETLTGPRRNPQELGDHLITIVHELEDKLTLNGGVCRTDNYLLHDIVI